MGKKATTKSASTKKPAEPPRFEGEVMARAIADYADTKKAEDIVILDVRGISPVTDYFLICTVSSAPQLRAVRNEIWEKLIENHGVRPLVREDNLESLWLILHYGDVMVHIFLKEKREFYSLEDLWNDAPRVKWEARPAPAAPRTARKIPKKASKAVKSRSAPRES